jgi:pyrroline-5-carboxylate reductase
MSALGFIGTGHIAAPMVRFLARKGHEVSVSRRNEAVSAALAAEVGVAVRESQEVIDHSDIVVLCLRPQVAETALEGLRFRAGQQVISVMAGITRDRLATLCAPAMDFVQTVPLGFVEKGGCPLAAFGNAALLAELFEPENPVVPLRTEEALDAHFAVSATTAGLLDLLDTNAAWLAERTGDVDGAEFFTSQMFAGFLAALNKRTAGELAAERDALASDRTLNLLVLDVLRGAGAPDALKQALDAVEDRLNG